MNITIRSFGPTRLRTQLILGIAFVHLLLMSVFVFDVEIRQKLFLKEQNHQQTFRFVSDYAVNSTRHLIANDFDELERLTLSYSNFPNLKYAMILSPDGLVMAHTNITYVGKKPTDPISRRLFGLTGTTTLVEDDHVLDVATPILADRKMIGWARIGVGQEYIQKNLASIVRNGVVYILVALLAGIFFAVVISNKLTGNLYKLITTADRIKAGDRTVRAAPFQTIELSKLGTAFNQMLDDIGANERLLSMVIENMPVGVWILNEKGEVVSGNTAGKEIWGGWQPVGVDELQVYKGWFVDTQKPIGVHEWAAARAIQNGETTVGEEIEIETFHGQRKMILNSALPLKNNSNQIIGAIAINVDITEQKRTEQMIRQFNRLYRFTSAINEKMLHAESKAAIYAEACRMAIEKGDFSLAFFANPTFQKNQVEFYACAGNNNGYLDIVQQQVSPEDVGQGAAGEAMKNKRPFYINNIATDPVKMPWRNEALKRGFRSLISFPVMVGSRLEAIFTLYTEKPNFFNDEEVRLLQEVVNNISFAIEKLELKNMQKQAEEQLKESEEKFRKLVEETLAGVFILQERRFVYVNPQLEKISGYSKEELLSNMTFDRFIYKADQRKVSFSGLQPSTETEPADHQLLKAVRKNGSVAEIEMIVSPITYEGKPAVIGTVIDVTEEVEEEKRISKAVTEAQETERQQISMELHDNVKQMMAACLLQVDLLKMMIPDEKTSPVISTIKSFIRESIEELRRISHQLAPTVDEAVPLEEKIRTVVETMNIANSLTVNYHFHLPDNFLQADVQMALYRIVQEQFANILKHAKASVVDLTVQRNNGEICMVIQDNGVGFDPSVKRNGNGLENIKRRVRVFNGNVSIQSQPGKGCRLYIELPANHPHCHHTFQ